MNKQTNFLFQRSLDSLLAILNKILELEEWTNKESKKFSIYISKHAISSICFVTTSHQRSILKIQKPFEVLIYTFK